jgi:hypothetical protein
MIASVVIEAREDIFIPKPEESEASHISAGPILPIVLEELEELALALVFGEIVLELLISKKEVRVIGR